jgi:pimeloyl-[acyl-carrier protein] methyl ester esterase
MNRPHVLVYGQGRPLVLFHGWGFDVHIWTELLPYLVDQYKVYLVDLPGFGLTPNMSFDAFKVKLLDELPLNFGLIGWSMGGLFATKLALEAPERVTHLVNISSSPYFIREAGWPGIDGQVFNAFYQALSTHPKETLERFIRLQCPGQSLPQTHSFSSSGLATGLTVLMNCDLRQNMKQLKVPAYYLFGHLDAIVPRRTMVTMQKMYPDFNYRLFEAASHAPFLSHPNQFKHYLDSIFL